MTGFLVKQAGMLTLLQDLGRFGAFNIGLTNGGPLDKTAFNWANRLCENQLNTTALEITVGGLILIAKSASKIAVTGAAVELFINSQQCELWRSHTVKSGDEIKIDFAQSGMRAYLAVAGGFQITPSFASTATVCREGIGGLQGNALMDGDFLPTKVFADLTNSSVQNSKQHLILPECYRPRYRHEVVLRTIVGYQQQHFSPLQQRLFFASEYSVTDACDRMGYRLSGSKIKADINGILSEGICHGAVQIPADGQPIVLLNDRQTIGGYPKIGSVISLDTAKLAQLGQGDKVRFEQITMEDAHNINHLAAHLFTQTQLQVC
jgi:biotin-dependent carboxylase-like uncharacterized protein